MAFIYLGPGVHRLPPVVLPPKSYYLRIPCPHIPYHHISQSNGSMIAPSPYPAPGPPVILNNVPDSLCKKNLPRPSLRISYYAHHVVLNWNCYLKHAVDYAPVERYNVYIREVSPIVQSAYTWKKVLHVNVDSFSHRCTTVKLYGGNTYYFATCAVDTYSRCGPCSVPKGISLLPSLYYKK